METQTTRQPSKGTDDSDSKKRDKPSSSSSSDNSSSQKKGKSSKKRRKVRRRTDRPYVEVEYEKEIEGEGGIAVTAGASSW